MDFDPELIKKLLMGLPEDYGSKQYYGPNNTVVPQQLPPPPPQKEDNYFSKDRSFASPGLDPFAGAQGSNAKWAFPPSHQTGLDQLLASMPPSPQRDVIPPSPPMYPNTTEIPKTGYPDSGRTGDFTPPYPLSTVGPGAGHNLLDEHSKNLIALENAKRVLGDINPYNPIEQSVNKTYQPMATTPISNEEQGGAAQLGDVRGVHNSLNAGLNAVMGASSISSHIAYAEKPWSSIFNANKFSWDKDRVDYLRDLTKKDLSPQERYETFKKDHPTYEGKLSSYLGQETKVRNLGGANIETGAAKVAAKELFSGNMEATIQRLGKEQGSYDSKFNQFQIIHPNYQGSRSSFIKKMDELKENVNQPNIRGPANWYDDTRGGGGTILSANRPGPGRGRNIIGDAHRLRIEAMGDRLKEVNDYKNQFGFHKQLVNRVRQNLPDLPAGVTDDQIVRTYQRMKSGQYKPQAPQPTTIGSEVPTKALDVLKQYGGDAVTKDWLRNWADVHGVELEESLAGKGKGAPNAKNTKYRTSYFTLKDPKNPENVATVRIPGEHEEFQHSGYVPNKRKDTYDTGMPSQLLNQEGKVVGERPPTDFTQVTQGNLPYRKQEVLDKALKHKFFGVGEDLQLISPDYARIKPEIGQGTPPRVKQDPNQLKMLFSNQSDPTTQGLIKIMQSRGGPQNLPGEMSSQQAKNAVSSINHLKTIEPSFVEDLSQHRSSVFDANPAWANTNEKINPGFSDIDRAKMTPKEKYDLAVFDQQISKKLIAMGHDPKDIPNIMKNMDTFDRMKLMHPELFNPFPGKPNG